MTPDPHIPPRHRPGWGHIPRAPGDPQPRLSDGWRGVEMDPADGTFWGTRTAPMTRAVFAGRLVQFAGGVSERTAGILWHEDPGAAMDLETAGWHLKRARRHLDQIEAALGLGAPAPPGNPRTRPAPGA